MTKRPRECCMNNQLLAMALQEQALSSWHDSRGIDNRWLVYCKRFLTFSLYIYYVLIILLQYSVYLSIILPRVVLCSRAIIPIKSVFEAGRACSHSFPTIAWAA